MLLTVEIQRGGRQISASVVTSTGTKISIMAAEELAETDLAKVTLKDDPTQLLEGLRKALANNDEAASALGSKLFDLKEYASHRRAATGAFPGFLPNAAQAGAVELTLGSEIAFIIGPPGTGKTATLAAIAYSLAREGKSVLIAAHTNIAVDNAILKLANMCKDLPQLRDGHIVRYGAPKLARVLEHESVYPPNIAKRVGRQLEQGRDLLQSRLKLAIATLDGGKRKEETQAQLLVTERAKLRKQQSHVEEEWRTLHAREGARMRSLSAEMESTRLQLEEAERHLQLLQQELARMEGRSIELTNELTQGQKDITALSQRASAAQRMNAVQRLVRGIHAEKLYRAVAEVRYRMSRVQQEQTMLEGDIASKQNERAELERGISGLRGRLGHLENQRQAPSSDSTRISALRIEREQVIRDVAALDARAEAESRGRNDLERAARAEIETLKQQIGEISSQLTDLEKRIVEDAQVVATTLTKTYLSASLRQRRFDHVIVDEVSIASLPALYIAASRADKAVTIIGDPYQLAPIVQAETQAAKAWLGRDIFAHARVTLEGAANGDGRSVLLDTQYRMNSCISIIARRHVYDELLRDGEIKPQAASIRVAPEPGSPLVLVDTSDGSPVAKRPSGGSRDNEFHRRCVLAIARQALETLPPLTDTRGETMSGENMRIGIATPYRVQAAKMQRLLKLEKLDGWVQAGTIHRFQGLEFEAVIFDTADSPPIKIRPEFIGSAHGSNAMRLVNVAVTRPQHKLIIVANVGFLLGQLSDIATLRLAITEAKKAKTMMSLTLPGMEAFSKL